MRVKGKAKKAQKSKGKGKSKAREQWSHDGGALFVEGAAKSQGKEVRRGVPRRTQEKDEWHRRGRLKFMNRQKSDVFARKMSRKLRYSDVLDEEKDDSAETILKTRIEPPVPNKLSALQRLRQFVRQDEGDLSDDDEDAENDLVESDGEEETEQPDADNREAGMDSNVSDAFSVDKYGKLSAEGTDVEETAVDGSVSVLYDVDEAADYWRSKQFTSVTNGSEQQSPRAVVLEALEDIEVVGTIDINSNQFPRVRMLGDIPAIPSVFQPRSQCCVGPALESMLVSYMSTYSDAMIEGRDYRNDMTILNAIMLHTSVHLVKEK
jgi:hypothetical protein